MKTCPKCKRTFPDESLYCGLDGVILKESTGSAHTQAGQIFNQRYRILAHIADGGMSVLYLARDEEQHREVVLKVLHEEYTRNTVCADRFRDEVQRVASVNHPNLLQVHEIDRTAEGNLFLAMDRVSGKDLKDVIRQGEMGIPRAIRLAAQIADGLDAAHRAGVVHRDLKPGNIMITGSDNPLVMNFGGARLKEAEELTRLTGIGMIFGTPAYMAPEQIEGGNVDERTDVYALGIVVYEMLSGMVPFRAPTPVAVLRKHLNETSVPLKELRRDVPQQLDELVTRALQKNPDSRWLTMSAMAQALRTIDAEASANTAPDSPPTLFMPVSRTEDHRPSGPTLQTNELQASAAKSKPNLDDRGLYSDTVALDQRTQRFDLSSERHDATPSMAMQPTMMETMALTQPIGKIRRDKQYKKWAVWAGSIVLVAGLVIGAAVFWKVRTTEGDAKGIETALPSQNQVAQIVSLSTDAEKAELVPKERARARLSVRYSDGQTKEISGAAQWASSDPSIVSIGPDGEMEAKKTGTAMIRGNYAGAEAPPFSILVKSPPSAPVSREPRLIAVSIRGGKTDIPTRGRLSLRAIGKYADGREKELRDGIRWDSSNSMTATVSSKGLVTGRSEGRAEIFARAGGLTSAGLTVTVVTPSPKASDSGVVKNEALSKAAQISEYIKIARSYRVRGAYAEALDELGKATKLDATSKDILTEIATTKRACRAEKVLGRSDLNC